MSQTLTITNNETAPVDLSVGTVPASGTLTVTVGGTIPADIVSAEAAGYISYTFTQNNIPLGGSIAGGITSVLVVDSAASTNAANVKASAGQVYGWQFMNTASYAVEMTFYDITGTPTVGTTSVKFRAPLAATSSIAMSLPAGIQFNNGIAVSMTKTDGSTALAAGDLLGSVFYE